MSIFSRISDIISANLNDLIDGIENPEKMLRQAVREMESTIGKATDSLAGMIAGQKLATRELEKNRQALSLWTERTQAAVRDGNDELARTAIGRKQEHAKLIAALQDDLRASDETIGKLRLQLNGMQAKLAEAKRRLTVLSTRKRAADLRNRVNLAVEGASIDTNAFAKFEHMREKVEMAEAQADAMRELGYRPDAVETAPAPEPHGDNPEVEAELAELKSRLKG